LQLVYDSANDRLKQYVDGTLCFDGNTDNPILVYLQLLNSNFDGKIDSLRVSNVVRAGSNPTEALTADASTVALYQFTSDFSDTSGNDHILDFYVTTTTKYVVGGIADGSQRH
jgi:hypothetical protein